MQNFISLKTFSKSICQSCNPWYYYRLSRFAWSCHLLRATTGKRNWRSKVLGASVPHVVALLSKDFLKLVIIALILSVPVAWYAMNEWLKDFAYRINIEWWIFLLAAIIAITIAFLTISTQAIKAAIANPVK